MLKRLLVLITVSLFASYPLCASLSGLPGKLKKERLSTEQVKEAIKSAKVSCPPPPPDAVTGVSVPQNPNALPGAFYPDPSVSNSLQPPPQKIDRMFVAGRTGFNPTDFPDDYWRTPDSGIAISKSQLLLTGNNGLVTFDKEGNRQDTLDVETAALLNLDGDFSLLLNSRQIRSRFDPHTGRFVIVGRNFDWYGDNTYTGLSLAISDTDEISDSTQWIVVNIFNLDEIPDSNGCHGDQGGNYEFPTLGLDKDAIYVGCNVYKGGGFLSSSLFVFQKESLFGSGDVVMTAFRDVTGYPGDSFPTRYAQGTLQPALNFDSNSQYGYVITTDPTMFGRLSFFRVINPASTSPTISSLIPIDVPTTGSTWTLGIPFAGNVYEPAGRLEYIDDRLQMAHVYKNQLYTAHGIVTDASGIGDPNGDRLACRWYHFDLKGKAPKLVEAGTLFDPSQENPLFYNLPAIMTNIDGTLSLSGTVSGLNQPISAFYVGRKASDPLGTLRIGKTPPNLFATGSGPYTVNLNNLVYNQQDWGEISYTSLDPEDQKSMWTVQVITVDGAETQVVAKIK